MLLNEFDSNKIAVFNPETFHKKVKGMPKTAVCFFPKSLMREIVKVYNAKQIEKIENATMKFPVYKISVNDVDLAIMQVPVGAPACVANLEELISMGVKNLILVGCCGCLNSTIDEYGIILPTSAIRDEGTSYHYLPEADETVLDEKFVAVLEKTLKQMNVKYIKGKTWTTDAIFRETKTKLERRKKQGAITVDMECSAVNVLAEFRGVHFGQIFYAADNLGGEEYDPRHLAAHEDELHDKKKAIIPIALECALAINKRFK